MADGIDAVEIVYNNVSSVDDSSIICLNPPVNNKPSADNYLSSVITLVNCTIGVNVLIMPKLFHLCGVWLGSLLLLMFALINLISSSMLCRASDLLGINSYFEICERIFKGKTRYAIHAVFILLLLGKILCYHAFVHHSINLVVEHVFLAGHNSSTVATLTRLVISIACNLCILPFVFERKLKTAKLLSKLCTLGIASGITLMMGAYLFPSLLLNEPPQVDVRDTVYANFKGIYAAMGVFMLSYCYQLVIVDVNQEAKPKNGKTANIIITASCLLSFAIYLVVSMIGYSITLENHEDVDKLTNVLGYLVVYKINYSLLACIVYILITVAIALSNVINYLPLIRFLNWKLNTTSAALSPKLLGELNLGASANEYELTDEEFDSNYTKVYNSIVIGSYLVVLSITMLLAVLNVRVEIVFDVVSAACVSPVCILIPAYIYMHAVRNTDIKAQSYTDLISAYGVAGIGAGLWALSIYAVFKA